MRRRPSLPASSREIGGAGVMAAAAEEPEVDIEGDPAAVPGEAVPG